MSALKYILIQNTIIMKKIKYLTIITLIIISVFACKREVSEPEIYDISFSLKNSSGMDSLVKEGVAGEMLTITVKTDANFCVIWPSGISDPLKSEVNPEADSVDIHGVVMRRCDDYSVYQQQMLTGAYGHVMQQLIDMSGFTLEYQDEETEEPGYLYPGEYVVTVIATKDGYNGSYKNTTVTRTIKIN